MKKILFILLTLIPTLAFAQSTVYFGNISKKTSIGLGLDKATAIISIMETNKKKTFDDYELVMYNMDGEALAFSMEVDTIYDLKIDKTYAHQKDYKMSIMDYQKLKRALDSQSTVKINGNVYNGASIVGLLNSLETEQRLFLAGKLQNVNRVSLWSWGRNGNRPNVEFMRFVHPQAQQGFRYIRSRR